MDKKEIKQNDLHLLGGGKTYKEKIIEMVEQVEDEWILNQIYKCIVNITK